MKFDDVLLGVGEFGLYQKRLLLLIGVTGGCVLIHNLSPVFTMKVPKYRSVCLHVCMPACLSVWLTVSMPKHERVQTNAYLF